MTDETAGRTRTNPWQPIAEAWSKATGHMARSVGEANRAAAAAFGVSADGAFGASADAVRPAILPAMAYRRDDWEFETTVDSHEDLGVGDRVTFTKRLTDADVHEFAHATGDTNRLHLDEAFASKSRFGNRIVHGTLVAGLISAALARLPLVTIYLSQDLEFLAPVEIGDRLTAVCEIVEDLGGDRYRLSTHVVDADDGETIIDGEAIVLIDDLPADEA